MNKAIYLDNNATTPVDPRVTDAITDVLKNHFGNPASSTHTFGWYAEELVKIAREHVASSINASPEEIIFTSGATEAINLALFGSVNNKGRIISVETEHKAALDPLAELKKRGHDVVLLKVKKDGLLDPSELEAALSDETILVSIMLANNEIGVIHDVKKLAEIVKKSNAIFHCDATQALGKVAVDTKELEVDLLSLSAHKIYGPKGVGALYIRSGQPKVNLKPLILGGGHEKGLRSGTPNVSGIVGFGKACEILNEEWERDAAHLTGLAEKLHALIKENIAEVTLNGSQEYRIPGNLNLSFPSIKSSRLIGAVNSKLAVSSTSACVSGSSKPSHVLNALGLSKEQQEESIRIGIGRFNTSSEIKSAAEILVTAVGKFS